MGTDNSLEPSNQLDNHREPDESKNAPQQASERKSIVGCIFDSKVLFVLFAISLLWTLSLFAVPFMMPPGTVSGLEGRANKVDFGEVWDPMPLFPKVIYYIGDAQCHQISERTIYLNGNQMPVCARDVSIFLFLTAGLFAGMFLRRSYFLSKGLLGIFPKRFRESVNRRIGANWFALLFVLLCFVPLALDGGLQLFTEYESNNVLRFLTGLPAGFIVGLLLAVMIKSVKAIREYSKKIKEEMSTQPGS